MIHKDTYKAAQVHWMQWANFIAASDAYRREELFNGHPPNDILEYFGDPDDEILQSTRRGVAVSQTVNDGIKHDISLIHQRVLSFRESVNRGLDDLIAQIEQIQLRNGQTDDLLEAFSQDLRPEETPFSRREYNTVPNQEDVDHGVTDEQQENENLVEENFN